MAIRSTEEEPSAQRERQLLAELLDARQAIRARDDFLAIAAHELRDPIHTIGLQLEALERLAVQRSDDELIARIRRVKRSLDGYAARANTLLDISRINSGLRTLSLAPVRLAELVAEAIEWHGENAQFHRVALLADVPGDIVGRWDRQAIEQVVLNVVGNAIKYGARHPVEIGAHADAAGGSVRICVDDRGPGIPRAARERVFGRFERLVQDEGRTSGFGLGLWICREFVEAHRGTIAICDRDGGGTRVTIELPLDADTLKPST